MLSIATPQQWSVLAAPCSSVKARARTSFPGAHPLTGADMPKPPAPPIFPGQGIPWDEGLSTLSIRQLPSYVVPATSYAAAETPFPTSPPKLRPTTSSRKANPHLAQASRPPSSQPSSDRARRANLPWALVTRRINSPLPSPTPPSASKLVPWACTVSASHRGRAAKTALRTSFCALEHRKDNVLSCQFLQVPDLIDSNLARPD